MLEKIKQAMRMWKAGKTHGEIMEVTGLAREQELAATEIASAHNLSVKHIDNRLSQLKAGMSWDEVEATMLKER